MKYVMLGFSDAAHHLSLQYCVWGVRCSGVEFQYLVSLLIVLSMFFFIMVITYITNMAIPFELQI